MGVTHITMNKSNSTKDSVHKRKSTNVLPNCQGFNVLNQININEICSKCNRIRSCCCCNNNNITNSIINIDSDEEQGQNNYNPLKNSVQENTKNLTLIHSIATINKNRNSNFQNISSGSLPRRKSSPMLIQNSDIVTASLQIPVQTNQTQNQQSITQSIMNSKRNSLDEQHLDIPYTEENTNSLLDNDKKNLRKFSESSNFDRHPHLINKSMSSQELGNISMRACAPDETIQHKNSQQIYKRQELISSVKSTLKKNK